MVFIGTDDSICEIPWNPQKPTFHLERIEGEYLPVADKFSKKNVYYVGTTRGCGCDFGIYEPRTLSPKEIADLSGGLIVTGLLNVFQFIRKVCGLQEKWLAKQHFKHEKQLLEYAAYESDNLKLVQIIEAATGTANTTELYCCWAGEYPDEVAENETIDINKTQLIRDLSIDSRVLKVYMRGLP